MPVTDKDKLHIYIFFLYRKHKTSIIFDTTWSVLPYLKVMICPFGAVMNHSEHELGKYPRGKPADVMISVSSLYSSWKQSEKFINTGKSLMIYYHRNYR